MRTSERGPQKLMLQPGHVRSSALPVHATLSSGRSRAALSSCPLVNTFRGYVQLCLLSVAEMMLSVLGTSLATAALLLSVG